MFDINSTDGETIVARPSDIVVTRGQSEVSVTTKQVS